MHRCGGKAQCGTCRIRIIEGTALNLAGDAERSRLGEDALAAGYRLACQSYAWGDVSIEVPPVEKNSSQTP